MPIRDKVYEKLKSIGLTDSKEDFFKYYDNDENVRKHAYNKLRDAGLTDTEEDFYEYMKPKSLNEDDAVFEANAERFRNGQPTEKVTTQSMIDAHPELGLGEQTYQYKPEVQQRILQNKPDMFKPKHSLMDAPLGVNAPEGSDEKFQARINVVQKNLQDPEYQKSKVKSEFRVLSDSVDADLEKIEDAITSRQKAVRNTDWKPGMPSSRDDAKLSELRGQRTYLEGAKELIEDSQNILNAVEAEKDGSFFGGLGRGIRDKAFDIDTWTMGLSDLVGGLRLKSVLEKAEKGETLTPAEQKLLDASVNNMAVNFYYRNDLGLGYQAGEITGQSIPFMLEFLVNPVSASGNAMAKRLLTYGLKRFGSVVNSKAIKAGTRLATDALAAGGVTATTGMGHVLSGGVERLNKNYEYGLDEEGNLNVVNTHNMGVGEAFAKSATSAFLERQSEMIFNAFRGAPSLFKGIETSLPGGVNTFMNYVRNSRLGELWKGIKNNATMKELAKRTQFHGLGEEYLEEVYNNFANIPLGEMTFEEATDLENNIVTFLGLAPTQVMFSAIGGIGYGVERYKAKRDLERTFGKMNEEQKRKLMELQEMGKLSTNKDIAFFLAETIKDESLTPEQKRAEIEYAYNLAKQNAIDEVSNTDLEDTIEAENVAIDAVTNIATGEYIEVERWVLDGETGERVPQPGYIVGWIGEAPVFVPEGMENAEENRIVLKPNEWNPETVQRMPAEEVKALNEEMIREEAAAQAERESKYAPEVLSQEMQQGIPFETEDAIYVPISPMLEGNGWVVEVQPKGVDNKSAARPFTEELTNDQFHDLLQAQLDAQEAVQAEAAKVEESNQSIVEGLESKPMEDGTGRVMQPKGVQGNEVVYDITDGNGTVLEEGSMDAAEYNGVSEESKVSGQVSDSVGQERTEAPVIPTKEDGSVDFVSYGKEGTFKALGEKYGEKMPNKVAVTAKALADDLAKAQKKLDKAIEDYDNAPIGREDKSEKARDKAQQEFDAIKREADFWAEMDTEIKDAQFRRASMLNPQAETETSNEPMNADEFVAQQLSAGNIVLNKEDYKRETGYGDAEANAMNGGAAKMFGENGMTIQEAGERLMEMDRENGTNFFDQNDPNAGRDALISLLGNVKSRKELSQYIANNRAEQAKKESEGLRNELERSVMDANYASLEDYVLQMEASEMENPFSEVNADEILAIFAEAVEEYNNYLNPQENGQGTTEETIEGNGELLSEEQSGDTGGTEVRQESARNGEGAAEESETADAATEVELKQQEGETPLQFAERAAEENRRRPLRKRAEEWSKALGVDVIFVERLEDVDSQVAYFALMDGEKVSGWYEGMTGKVYFYMPNLDDISEVDKTYIHEVVAHKGLKEMLGKERFDELCDKVWDMMPSLEKAKFIRYPGVNGNTRAAADEYIAHLAEKEELTPEEKTMWDRVVKAFRDIFETALNAIIGKVKLTDEDISNLIKASYANLKSGAEGGADGRNDKRESGEDELVNRTLFRAVTDKKLIDKLESEPKIKVYRAMQLIDGKLYPPMSAKVDGKMREPIELGKWEMAEERPDLADEKGYFKLDKGNKTSLKARYNPYIHTSTTPLNDQFSSAQSRPELVTVEVEIPESELTSGYKAEKAKDAVGKVEWKAGVVQGKLSGTRTVILSRYDKPIRIVPDSEVADEIVKMFDGKDITMPSNVVTPSLRAELEKRGVPFVETDNQGKAVGTRFRTTKEEQSIIDKAKSDGTYMLAPNGEPTNLTEKQWAQVRTEAFKKWFGDWEKNPKKSSLMIDENGEPKVYYHGSPSRFNEFISDKMGETGTGYGQGFYFSPEKWFAEGYVGENGGTLYEVFLNLRKPISDTKKTLKKPSIKRFIDEIDKRMMKRDDDGIGILDNWDDVSYYGRNKVLNEATEAVFEYNETDLEIVGDLINTSGSYDVVTEVLRDILGFDGVLPSNTDNEVIVHHPNQIKSATDNVGTFDEGNNDIRFRAVKDKNELVAVHNISEENLRKVLKIGGLIMPSIAITKADMGHEGYGEISLLFDKETINPTDRRNKVYGGDAWTPRFPSTTAKINDKVSSKVYKKIKELIDDRSLKDLYSLSAELHADNIERTISDRGVEGYYNKEWMKLAYLLDNGKKVKIPMKMKDYGDMSEKILEMVKEKELKASDIQDGGYKFYQDNTDIVEAVKRIEIENKLQSFPEEKRDALEKLLNEKEMTYSRFDSLISSARRMEYDLENGGLKKIIDRAALRESIEKKVKTNNADYNKWVDSLFDGIVEKYGIRNNRDWYTPSGNLRPWEQLYDNATPANILKHMLAENEQGGSGGFFDSNIMGASAETYESIEEIREKGKKRLRRLEDGEYDEWSNSISERMSEICNDFLSPSQRKEFGAAIDTKIDITNAVAKDKTADGIYKAMKRKYPGFKKEHAKKVEEIVKEIQDFSIGYFEAKPRRIVPLSEVRKAIVPKKTSSDIVEGLKNNGIEVSTYKNGDEVARARLIKKESNDIRFRFIGERGARNLDKAEEATTRLDNLAVAREMEAAKRDERTIKMATGWERGADGLWRYEVDDNIDFELRRPKRAELKKAYEEANEKYYKLEMRIPTRTPKNATEEEKQRIKELRKELAKLRKGMNKAFDAYYDYSAESATLGEFLGKDNQLFKEYPELADYDVSFLRDSKKLAEGLKGSFTPEYKVIWVDDARPKGDIKSTLVHEIQHAIQGIEGFSQGGTPAAFASAKYQAEEWKANFNEFINRYGFEDWSKNLPIEDWMKYGKEYKGQFGGLHRAFIDNAVEDEDVKKTLTKELDYVKAAYDKFYQIAGGMDPAYKFKDANEWYRSLSGEVESRNVQQRMGMTDEQRRNTLAESTEDVAREDQVFLKDGIESGETRFRSVNEPAVDYISQAEDVVEVPRDEVMYTMNNIANQLYKTSGRFMRQLYKYGTLGRVLKGEYAEIDQIKAKNEYDHAKPILEEYLNELVWMKYQATEAAQEVINDVISDVEYAMQYYKDLSLGKDVWRTQSSPRFRISEKGKQIQEEVDKFASKYNSKPVVLVDSEMTDEELEEAVPESSANRTREEISSGYPGGYSRDTDKIYIFVDNQEFDDLGTTMFHENLHPLYNGSSMVEELYNNAKEDKKALIEALSEAYEESEIPNEMFAHMIAKDIVRGDFKFAEKYLSEESRNELFNTLKEFGYDRVEEESIRRRQGNLRSDITLDKEPQASEQVDGGLQEGKAVSPRERKERLGKLFDQVADMGLEGVLENKAYTSMMVDIYKTLPEAVRTEIADDAIRLYGGSVAPAVSDYIGVKSKESIIDKIVTIVREALRKVGFDLDLNANEVRYLAWRSKKPLDRNNLLEVAEDIDMKNRLKVGEYDGTTPDGGGTRFRTSEDVLNQIKQARREVEKAPSEAQKEAGNYKKGHISLDGFEITLENPKGGTRSGVDKNGKKWSVTMNNDYGYIRGTEAVDGDHIDVFLSDNPTEGRVFVVDQSNEEGTFDESKVMYGFNSLDEARNAYLSNYEKGWEKRIMDITEVSKDEFKKWIDSSHKKTKAFSEYKSIKSENNDIRFRVGGKLNVRDKYEATIKKGGYQAREAVQDAMLSLRKFQELIEKVTGKKIRDFENAWMHENRLSSVVQAEIHEMERKFYKPMMDAVKKLMDAANLEQEQVADYLMLKHGIERNREMAVRKALTDDQGKIDRTQLEQWYQEKQNIRNDASLDTWRKKQEAMDNLALMYGADMSRDYSGLTSMFGTDDLADSTQKAYDEVEALENAHPTETESLGKAIKAMTQSSLDKAFESGLMDRKVYNELTNDMYDYYIPLRGFDETTSEEVYAYLDQDRGAFNAPLVRAKGRSSKSDNPIAYLKSIAESGIMQGNRNKMKQSFLNMVMNNPSDLVSVREGVWAIFNPASGEWEAATPPTIPNNATPADVEAAMEAWEQQMEQAAQNDPTLVKKVAEAADVPYRVVGNRMNQHQVIVKRLGKSYTLTINGNPRLAMALNGQTNPNNTSNDGKVAAYVSGKIDALNRNLSAWYTTRNPDFVASNFMRDTFYTNTIVRAKEGNAYANKFHKNYAKLLKPGKMINLFRKYENGTLDASNKTEAAFLDFMMNGGETGYSNLKDLEHIKKQIAKELKGNKLAKLEKVAEKLDILNRAVENTARFAAYLTSRQEGRSIAKSIFDAKEISVNFNKKGAGGTFFGMTGQTRLGNLGAMVGAGGRAFYVFFNAAIQGTTNLMHVMKVNPKGTSAGVAAMFLMGAVVPMLFAGDDDEKNYYDLPEHVRRNHLIIPGTGDAWVSIPLPIEYRIMYGMGELLTSWRTGHERGSDIARKMLNLTGQALPLNFLEEGFDAFIPSALSPIWQVYNNKSWTGLPIYKDTEFNKDDPEYTKAYKNVDRLLYNFSKSMYEWTFDEENQKARVDLNPAVMESLARGYFGGLATQLSNLGKTWETIAGEREFDWRSIPIGNRVFKSGDERTKEKRITNEYFENMEKLEFLQARERLLKKTINGVEVPEMDKEKAKIDDEIMRGSEVYQKYMEFKKLKKTVDKIRKTIKEKGSTPELEKALSKAQEEANKAVR